MPRHHRIDYIELTAPDLASAKAFYAGAFGWTFTDYGPGYVGFSDGREGEAGGIVHGTPQAGGPLVILYSDDLLASREAVRAAGGTITKDIYEFPGGKRFELADPAGNALAVWATV